MAGSKTEADAADATRVSPVAAKDWFQFLYSLAK